MRIRDLPWSLRWRLWLLSEQVGYAYLILFLVGTALFLVFFAVGILAKAGPHSELPLSVGFIGLSLMMLPPSILFFVHVDARAKQLKSLGMIIKYDDVTPASRLAIESKIADLAHSYAIRFFVLTEKQSSQLNLVRVEQQPRESTEEPKLIPRKEDPKKGQLVPVEGAEPDTYFLIEDD